MSTRQKRYSSEEMERRADAIFEEIRPKLKRVKKSHFLAINVETGDYEFEADEMAASKRLHSRVPDAQIWMRRSRLTLCTSLRRTRQRGLAMMAGVVNARLEAVIETDRQAHHGLPSTRQSRDPALATSRIASCTRPRNICVPKSSARSPGSTCAPSSSSRASCKACTPARFTASPSSSASTASTSPATTSRTSTGTSYAKTDKYYLKKFQAETNVTGYLAMDLPRVDGVHLSAGADQVRVRHLPGRGARLPDDPSAGPGRPGHVRHEHPHRPAAAQQAHAARAQSSRCSPISSRPARPTSRRVCTSSRR